MLKITSNSAKLTKNIAAQFIKTALQSKKSPRIFLLNGDLGAGKTTFMLGVLSYFGIRPHAASPTFVLAKRYSPKKHSQKVKEIYHADAYRLKTKKDLHALELPFKKAGALFFIEWPERVGLRSPKGSFVIRFHHGSHIDERIIEITRR